MLTVDLNEATIVRYVQDQEKADSDLEKLTSKEYEDPFKKPTQAALL